MIRRVGENIKSGEIIEFNGISEPLYIYGDGELHQITPNEYSFCVMVEQSVRFRELMDKRLKEKLRDNMLSSYEFEQEYGDMIIIKVYAKIGKTNEYFWNEKELRQKYPSGKIIRGFRVISRETGLKVEDSDDFYRSLEEAEMRVWN